MLEAQKKEQYTTGLQENEFPGPRDNLDLSLN